MSGFIADTFHLEPEEAEPEEQFFNPPKVQKCNVCSGLGWTYKTGSKVKRGEWIECGTCKNPNFRSMPS